MKTVLMVDYGMGNLHSASKALESLGAKVCYAKTPEDFRIPHTHLELPGVGAFPDAMALLNKSGMADAIREDAASGTPLLGVCLGMQLLFSFSTEGERTRGLGLMPGGITLMDAGGEKIPHMGWNEVRAQNGCPLMQGVDGRNFYFVHSYCAADVHSPIAAGVTEYGNPFISLCWDGKNVYGAQFHPEKSGEAGLTMLRSFLDLTKGGQTQC